MSINQIILWIGEPAMPCADIQKYFLDHTRLPVHIVTSPHCTLSNFPTAPVSLHIDRRTAVVHLWSYHTEHDALNGATYLPVVRTPRRPQTGGVFWVPELHLDAMEFFKGCNAMLEVIQAAKGEEKINKNKK